MHRQQRAAMRAAGTLAVLFGCATADPTGDDCATCGIVVTELPPLGERDGPLAIATLESRSAENSAGDVVLYGIYASMLPVLDRQGGLRRTLGQLGSGPGDLREVGSVAFGANDSLFVFEWGNVRYSVFSPQYEFIASGPLPFQPQMGTVVLPDGQFVFNLALGGAGASGQPLHLVGRDGRLLRSFGSEDPESLRGVPNGTGRALAATADGPVWTAYNTQYVMELWNPDTGVLLRRLKREVDWFPPRMTVVPRDAIPPAEPQPFVSGLRHDAANRALWVLLRVADPLWEQVIGPREGHGYVSVSDEQGYYDSVVEVLDDTTGELLASVRLPYYLRQFLGDDQVGGVVEDDEAIPYYVRNRLGFTRAAKQAAP